MTSQGKGPYRTDDGGSSDDVDVVTDHNEQPAAEDGFWTHIGMFFAMFGFLAGSLAVIVGALWGFVAVGYAVPGYWKLIWVAGCFCAFMAAVLVWPSDDDGGW